MKAKLSVLVVSLACAALLLAALPASAARPAAAPNCVLKIASIQELDHDLQPTAEASRDLVAVDVVELRSGQVLLPGSRLAAGDAFAEGRVRNGGDRPLLITFTDGSTTLVEPHAEALISIGDPSHKCICECECKASNGYSETITLDCPGTGNCGDYNAVSCELSTGGTGTSRNCTKKLVVN